MNWAIGSIGIIYNTHTHPKQVQLIHKFGNRTVEQDLGEYRICEPQLTPHPKPQSVKNKFLDFRFRGWQFHTKSSSVAVVSPIKSIVWVFIKLKNKQTNSENYGLPKRTIWNWLGLGEKDNNKKKRAQNEQKQWIQLIIQFVSIHRFSRVVSHA